MLERTNVFIIGLKKLVSFFRIEGKSFAVKGPKLLRKSLTALRSWQSMGLSWGLISSK